MVHAVARHSQARARRIQRRAHSPHVQSFVRPIAQMADARDLADAGGMPTFSFGAMSAASMVRAPVLQAGISPPACGLAMRREVREARMITDALLQFNKGPDEETGVHGGMGGASEASRSGGCSPHVHVSEEAS